MKKMRRKRKNRQAISKSDISTDALLLEPELFEASLAVVSYALSGDVVPPDFFPAL